MYHDILMKFEQLQIDLNKVIAAKAITEVAKLQEYTFDANDFEITADFVYHWTSDTNIDAYKLAHILVKGFKAESIYPYDLKADYRVAVEYVNKHLN